MNRVLEKACACQGNKGQIKGQLVMFCIQWKLVHIIAAFEMCKALFPLPDSFLSLIIVLMNWKGHDICEELKKKCPATPPRARGQLPAQRAVGARAEQS